MNAMTSGVSEQRRLEPAMVSFRVLVSDFARRYISTNGTGPSYGEIAAGLSTNRERVRKAVKRLVRDGVLVRVPGPRGLRMPEQVHEAIELLRMAGWAVNEDIETVTKRPLLPPAELRYPKRGSIEGNDGNGQQADEQRRARAR
jgi:biotin operon repressor